MVYRSRSVLGTTHAKMSQSETETKAETGGDEPETMGATLIAEALKSQVRFSLCSVVWFKNGERSA